LPPWHGRRTLASGEVFLLLSDVPASFEGRYFGPITSDAIIGRFVPLWAW
jgi:type IV secretory pathway protease TraF